MGFKINVDRFGFAKKPEPEKVSRDYAAEYAKSLVDNEAKKRLEEDSALHNEIIAESNARRADKAELQEEVDAKIATLLNAVELSKTEVGSRLVVDAMKQVVPTFHDPKEVNENAEKAEEMKKAEEA